MCPPYLKMAYCLHAPGHCLGAPGHCLGAPGHCLHAPGHCFGSPGHCLHAPGHCLHPHPWSLSWCPLKCSCRNQKNSLIELPFTVGKNASRLQEHTTHVVQGEVILLPLSFIQADYRVGGACTLGNGNQVKHCSRINSMSRQRV